MNSFIAPESCYDVFQFFIPYVCLLILKHVKIITAIINFFLSAKRIFQELNILQRIHEQVKN